MGRPGVLFRFELLDALERLDPADAGRLFLGAMRYGKDGALPTFQNPLLSVVWPFIKTAVDHDAETYDSKILQKRFAVYVREAKKAGLEPMAFEVWKQSADITRCQPISGDIHNHTHIQCHNHSQIQEQEHTQENTAASPPAPARDSRNLVFLDDEQYSALVADLGEHEVQRCISYLSEYYRTAIPQMLHEMCGGDEEKIKANYLYCTKAEARGYAGVDNIGEIKDAALPVVYGKVKKAYEKRMGHSFAPTA